MSTMAIEGVSQAFLDFCIDIARRSRASPIISTGSDISLALSNDSPFTPPEDIDVDPETKTFYHGLPSKHTLIFRTGTPSENLTDTETYLVEREIRPVFDDKFAAVWEDMGTRIYQYLDSTTIRWTTIDIVRFAEPEKGAGPIVLWVGVAPGSLSRKDAQVAALACEQILLEFKIVGVEIAFRESLFRQSGPTVLLNYVGTDDPTASVRSAFTPALGLSIASQPSCYYAEGTGALYLCIDEKVYILTARHVVFPPNDVQNQLYHRTQSSQTPIDVILPGPEAFQGVLESIMVKIADEMVAVDLHKRQLDELVKGGESGNTDSVELERPVVEASLRAAEASIRALDTFHSYITKFWFQELSRIIGHVAYAPPITVGDGTKPYTEDWALIELDHDKIDWTNFKGNVIDLGTQIEPDKFIIMMHPDPKAPTSFQYPVDGLLPVRGVVPEDELAHPRMRDAAGEPCILLIKNGCTTNTTIGRGTGIKSFVRHHFPDGTEETSMELAIVGYNNTSEGFSDRGDSGAIIVDRYGRVAALLTGRSGQTGSADITYGTPFEWLLERIKAKFPNAHLYPST